MSRKGIILAGGSGSRLHPITLGVSKQLLPIYDKPMIYYPLSVLMLAGIREILIITTPDDVTSFERLLGNGEQWGLTIKYAIQPSPDGLAQAYILGEEFLAGSESIMILGDNIFFGDGLSGALYKASYKSRGASVFAYQVNDPERYGVVDFDSSLRIKSIEEKPIHPKSDYAVTGLYFMDGTAPEKAKKIEPSGRGELEIVSLLQMYIDESQLSVETLGRGYAWFDTGTHSSLLEASNFVRSIQARQGLLIGSPEEIAYDKGWISRSELLEAVSVFGDNEYASYLKDL